jgi:hypothetical protein
MMASAQVNSGRIVRVSIRGPSQPWFDAHLPIVCRRTITCNGHPHATCPVLETHDFAAKTSSLRAWTALLVVAALVVLAPHCRGRGT